MQDMDIVTTPDPRLRQKCRKVNKITDEALEIIAEMRKASLEWEKSHPYELSAAMAAPQLGFDRRIIIVRDDLNDKKNKTFTALVDPEVIKTEGKIESDFEGCLSVPAIYGKVPRPTKVKIKAMLEDGTPVRVKAEDSLARTLLHEIDHLNGVLFIDHIKDDPKAFFRMNDKGDLEPVNYDTEIKDNKTLWGEDE
ncbi:peptide deformylase [Candidatus Saccharibacteria bacterium]|nr:peptide deformylase [Candidatus Saccharibacteria bacterium]